MIDHSLMISPTAGLVFHLKQGFWLYAWPMMVGFLTILGYQVLGRIVMMGAAKWRGIHMIPFYGCGVGLASAMMSRVYAITMPVISMPSYPRLKMRTIQVIWRGDTEGIEKLRQALRARV